jgi:hypothetical protein
MNIQKILSLFILSLTCNYAQAAKDLNNPERLKTLFTTQQERRQLDELRGAGSFDALKDETSGPLIRLEPLKVEVKGIVFREKGKPVVWINKGNTLKSKKIDDDIRVRTKYVKIKNLKVPVKVSDRSLRMKPGQVWLETDDKIKDKYQIKPPKAETNEGVIANIKADNEGASE